MPMSERVPRKSIPEPNTGCWLWLGTLAAGGYGTVSVPGREKGAKTQAHRASYEAFVGPIPAGLEIDHMCKVRSCVNPRHLRAVTHRENLMASDTITRRAAMATHCPAGHPYFGDNLIQRKGHGRECRICMLATARRASRKYSLRKRAARRDPC